MTPAVNRTYEIVNRQDRNGLPVQMIRYVPTPVQLSPANEAHRVAQSTRRQPIRVHSGSPFEIPGGRHVVVENPDGTARRVRRAVLDRKAARR